VRRLSNGARMCPRSGYATLAYRWLYLLEE
jgi:hypothetical protein